MTLEEKPLESGWDYSSRMKEKWLKLRNINISNPWVFDNWVKTEWTYDEEFDMRIFKLNSSNFAEFRDFANWDELTYELFQKFCDSKVDKRSNKKITNADLEPDYAYAHFTKEKRIRLKDLNDTHPWAIDDWINHQGDFSNRYEVLWLTLQPRHFSEFKDFADWEKLTYQLFQKFCDSKIERRDYTKDWAHVVTQLKEYKNLTKYTFMWTINKLKKILCNLIK